MKDIIIYGASGHARVIIDIIEQTNQFNIVGLVDNYGIETSLFGYPVETNISHFCEHGISAGLIAVGDNWQRSKLASLVRDKYPNFEFIRCIHPSVNMGRDVYIGEGSVIMAGCNINPRVNIMNHCVINTGSNVDHDCILESYASLAPGVTLGGNVVIGDYTAIGIGSSVIQKVIIGEHVVVGAGAVVVKNINSHCVAYGNPCKTIRPREAGSKYL